MNYFHAYIHKYKKRNKTYLEPKKKKKKKQNPLVIQRKTLSGHLLQG